MSKDIHVRVTRGKNASVNVELNIPLFTLFDEEKDDLAARIGVSVVDMAYEITFESMKKGNG